MLHILCILPEMKYIALHAFCEKSQTLEITRPYSNDILNTLLLTCLFSESYEIVSYYSYIVFTLLSIKYQACMSLFKLIKNAIKCVKLGNTFYSISP